MADKKVTEFALQTVLPTDTMLIVKSDGTVYRGTIEDIVKATNVVTGIKNKADVMYDSAAAHNATYRGKDLTEYCDSGAMSKAIAAGTFADIYPGDYITKKITVDGTTYTRNWIVGDLDYHMRKGDVDKATTKHHVLLYPDNSIAEAVFHTDASQPVAYQSSDMWNKIIPEYVTAIQSAFGADHVLSHREMLANNVYSDVEAANGTGNKGTSYFDWSKENAPWQDVLVNIFNETMIFGQSKASSSFCDIGDCSRQIASLREFSNPSVGAWCWTRSFAGANQYVIKHGFGAVTASETNISHGVLPYFLYY